MKIENPIRRVHSKTNKIESIFQLIFRNAKLLNLFLLPLLFFSCLESQTSDETDMPREAQNKIPHLKKVGSTTQLIVDNEPFIILGGELGNSTFTSIENMKSVWPKLQAMHLNTILVPAYWELIEPEEGVFDFTLFNQLIQKARTKNLKVVILWFASWKNSMSSHVPSWVKKDVSRFPRAQDDKGINQEILTPFSENNLQADLLAYKALMAFVKETNERESTVIMMQPENEIGMLPTARDYHPLANTKFEDQVPSELIDYLVDHKKQLVPEFNLFWQQNGYKTVGNWEEIFGKGLHTDEIFMAWHFAKYTEQIVAAGKEVYPLPMFVNAALNRPGRKPGEYPSAGPLPHLMDIWKAGGPSIDFLSPDFYNPDFKQWNDLYTRQENPLFVPEHRFDNTTAAKAAFTIGHYEGIGFSPFSIESTDHAEDEGLGKMYGIIDQIAPLISENQGKGKIEGVLLDKTNPQNVFRLGKYEFTFKHSHTLGWEANSSNDVWEMAGALVIQNNENEFYVAGSGVVATFKNLEVPESRVGILKVDEGIFNKGEWKVLRHLNGDQTHQGRHLRIFKDDYLIQRLELYNY